MDPTGMPDVATKLQQARADLVAARATQAANLPPAQRMARYHTRVQRAAEKVDKIKMQIAELYKAKEELYAQLEANDKAMQEQQQRLEQAQEDQKREEQDAKTVWVDTAPDEGPGSLAEFTKASKAKTAEAKTKFVGNAEFHTFIEEMSNMVGALPEKASSSPPPSTSITDTP
eukprot:4853874-Pyramimonas_sp.AAC.1